jgi:hypothetical protein
MDYQPERRKGYIDMEKDIQSLELKFVELRTQVEGFMVVTNDYREALCSKMAELKSSMQQIFEKIDRNNTNAEANNQKLLDLFSKLPCSVREVKTEQLKKDFNTIAWILGVILTALLGAVIYHILKT